MSVDPTAYALGGDPSITDPRLRRLDGYANHGPGHRLTMPFMTQVTANLWHGGVETGLVLPEFVQFKLSLYRWEDYTILHPLRESRTVTMHDSVSQDLSLVHDLADWVNERRQIGPVFVHCQAGLNRSSLVVAIALLKAGDVPSARAAVDLVREKRDPACLCNPAFERWVLDHDGEVAA